MQNAKEVLSALLSGHQAVTMALADGKVGLEDLALLVGPLMKLPLAIQDASLAIGEITNATEAERAQVLSDLKAEYDLSNDELEAKVEAGVELLMALGKFYGTVKGA